MLINSFRQLENKGSVKLLPVERRSVVAKATTVTALTVTVTFFTTFTTFTTVYK